MTCMLVLSGRVELMVMHGGVKNNYEHNVVVMNLPLCSQTAEFNFRSLSNYQTSFYLCQLFPHIHRVWRKFKKLLESPTKVF